MRDSSIINKALYDIKWYQVLRIFWWTFASPKRASMFENQVLRGMRGKWAYEEAKNMNK